MFQVQPQTQRTTFMTLGDPHFKCQEFYLERVVEMGEKFIELCRKRKPDFIVNLGDTLHDKLKIDMSAQNKAVQFMRQLKEIAPLFVLIGNHDRLNNSEFLTPVSPFEAMKEWPNTHIVDDRVETFTVNNVPFFFVPYVYPSRYKEALDKFHINPLNFASGFSHQEFKGCHMGITDSTEGDEWPYPIANISGHIHEQQKVGLYVNYVGTPIGHTHSELSRKTVSFFTCSREECPDLKEIFWCKSMTTEGEFYLYEEKIELNVKRLKTIHLNAKVFFTYDFQNEDPRYYKIIVEGNDVDIRLVKKSERYHELEKLGCKIHFPANHLTHKKEEKVLDKNKILTFHESIAEKLNGFNDLNEGKELCKLYQEILKEM